MSLIRWSDGWLKLASRIAGSLLVGVCAALALDAAAQGKDVVFLVVQGEAAPLPNKSNVTVFIAKCGPITATTKEATCKLTRETKNVCDPKSCRFLVRSTDQPPTPLTFGRSRFNETCAWVWDPYSYQYTYECWPD